MSKAQQLAEKLKQYINVEDGYNIEFVNVLAETVEYLSQDEEESVAWGMSKHTEGPWFVWGGTELIIKSKNRVIACASQERMDDWEKAKANARLLAAAPDLLEALINALPMLYTGDELPISYYANKKVVLGDALRAITKAKGGRVLDDDNRLLLE